jgi:quinol-cytochrome oxidoreductase complex cytochrome b subunit
MFFDFESSIKKLQSLSPELYKKYTAQYASEEKIKNNLSDKFFPYWNEELKKSCKTIQLAVKFYNNFYYEEIQKEAFNKFKTIYITNNTKIGEGYKAIKTDTYKECYGILPEKIKKSYEDYSGIFK